MADLLETNTQFVDRDLAVMEAAGPLRRFLVADIAGSNTGDMWASVLAEQLAAFVDTHPQYDTLRLVRADGAEVVRA